MKGYSLLAKLKYTKFTEGICGMDGYLLQAFISESVLIAHMHFLKKRTLRGNCNNRGVRKLFTPVGSIS